MINGLLTLRGAWHKVTADPVLKFFVVGVTFYGMATFEGPMLSIKSVNALSHYTDWTIAHVHGGALGWNGFMTFGMVYWLLPRLFQTPLWSKRLASTHFWLGTVGILLYVIAIYAAGLTQGLMWRAFDQTGRLQYPEFVETVAAIIPMYYVRAIGGLMYVVGMALCGVNVLMTWRRRPARYEEPVYRAAPLALTPVGLERAQSRLTGVIGLGHAADRWVQGAWHRRWERLPLRFTVFTIIAVSIGGLVEAVPTFLVRSNVPTIASVKPYTPLELAGRDLYVAEGCYNCHSQMIRPIYAETKRYGEYSKPGEFVYDHPFQWGSRRIGPDLAREGVTNPNALWHVQHFINPRDIKQQSIMPRYGWLLEQRLDFASIQARVDAMALLGVPYGEAVKNGRAVEMAREQAAAIAGQIEQQGGPPGLGDRKVVAMIAYLQRLGTDIYRPADAPGAPPVAAGPGK
jgi:cytochrome c oxidase cbb3-type subunit I/II